MSVSRSRTAERLARLALIAAALLALALPTVSPSSASATSGDYGRIASATALRYCSDTRCSSQTTVPANASVQVWCWRDGGSYKGTPRWFRVRYGSDGWVSAADMNPQPSVPYCNSLKPNERLYAGQSLWSTNSAYRVVMQSDGNFVLYRGSSAYWASRTQASNAYVVMQGDGNLVVYNSAGTALWNSGTSNAGSNVVMQDDGNFVLYTGSTALFATSWHRTLGQTQASNTGVAGNCTWYAYERIKQAQGSYPRLWGDAHNWNDAAQQTGWLVRSSPGTHSIVVFERSSPTSVGHVAWVDGIQLRSDGLWIHIWEMNRTTLNQITNRWVKHTSGMSYIMDRTL